ncbi:signal peptidase I [Clostridium sp. HBUAS56017]|uniref:signal peptidase I n=1 Tax=Clostridium sp. HBUAS56017 TaxID=2571128 RepID=UPI001178B665|nr:signal peptidase I [Clostridium sp. HBUAS56017]
MNEKSESEIEEENSIEGESNIDNNNEKKGKIKKKKNFFFEWIVPIIVAVAIAILIKQFLIFKVYIPSGSMIPTLNVGDHLFVTRVYNLNNIKRGDIIVFDSEELNDVLIKRLIGLPGDTVSIVNGKVSVNGEELDESYVKPENSDQFYGEFHVPDGKYFFLGDNRRVSFDSRKWVNPYVDGKDIKAKAQLKVYPFSDFGSVK